MFIRLFFIILIATSCCNVTNNQSGIVRLSTGLVSGEYLPDTKVTVYRGIPYAKPPIGDLRWKKPQSIEAWDGVLECKKFSANAMQLTPQPFSMWTEEFIAPAKPLCEDCLYLNVWTSAQKNEERPVIVFIHGGGFSSGSGSVPIYDGTNMAAKGVVFVTINYRVGIFGFFVHPELSLEAPYHTSGNYGLLDQIEALKWVKENIAALGGDPDNVTIAGQSAGAFSVNYLVASPLAKGLFHRAIAESGGAVLPTSQLTEGNTLESAEDSGKKLGEDLQQSSIAQLRKITADSLLKVRYRSVPIIDGYVLPKDVHSIFTEGQQNDVPVLTGWNANEGNFSGPIKSADDFKKDLKLKFGSKATELLQLFPADNDSLAITSQVELSGLQTFGVQAYAWAELQNMKATSPVYMYHFNRSVPFGERQEDYGAFHTGEVPYAYSNLDKSDVRPWTDLDYRLQQIMSSYWINFAVAGNPNGEGLPVWEAYSNDEHQTMILGKKVELAEMPQLDALRLIKILSEQ